MTLLTQSKEENVYKYIKSRENSKLTDTVFQKERQFLCKQEMKKRKRSTQHFNQQTHNIKKIPMFIDTLKKTVHLKITL